MKAKSIILFGFIIGLLSCEDKRTRFEMLTEGRWYEDFSKQAWYSQKYIGRMKRYIEFHKDMIHRDVHVSYYKNYDSFIGDTIFCSNETVLIGNWNLNINIIEILYDKYGFNYKLYTDSTYTIEREIDSLFENQDSLYFYYPDTLYLSPLSEPYRIFWTIVTLTDDILILKADNNSTERIFRK